MIKQVPYQVDVRTQQEEEGLIVVNLFSMVNYSECVNSTLQRHWCQCFSNYQIAHNRAKEGYDFTWYDMINETASDPVSPYGVKSYNFRTNSVNRSDVYFSVETYGFGMIPSNCTNGT